MGKTDEIPFKPVNVRTANGIDIEGLKVKKVDGASYGEKYEVSE